MKQFSFDAQNIRTGSWETIRATARTEQIARAHIVNYYSPQFEVSQAAKDVNTAHHTLGEIDCTSAGSEAFALALAGIITPSGTTS